MLEVLREIAACLGDYPEQSGRDFFRPEAVDWLLERRNSVAAVVAHALRHPGVKQKLKAAARGTWDVVTKPSGPADALWRRLQDILRPGNWHPDNWSATEGEFLPSVREGLPWDNPRCPLVVEADLLSPFAFGWHPLSRESYYMAKTGRGLQYPALGDFIATSAINRLHCCIETMTSRHLNPPNENLAALMDEVRGSVWNHPKYDATQHALTLVQVYLAGAQSQADWSVLGLRRTRASDVFLKCLKCYIVAPPSCLIGHRCDAQSHIVQYVAPDGARAAHKALRWLQDQMKFLLTPPYSGAQFCKLAGVSRSTLCRILKDDLGVQRRGKAPVKIDQNMISQMVTKCRQRSCWQDIKRLQEGTNMTPATPE